MGAQIRSCLSKGVDVVNGVPLLRNSPNKCLDGTPQTVTFKLEEDKLKIWHDYDDMANTDSLIFVEKNLKVILAQGDKRLATRTSVIADKINTILNDLNRGGVRSVVFADPRTSEEAIFEAIFRGLQSFTEETGPHRITAVYVPWTRLSVKEMRKIIGRV
jgi:hypothetical protein